MSAGHGCAWLRCRRPRTAAMTARPLGRTPRPARQSAPRAGSPSRRFAARAPPCVPASSRSSQPRSAGGRAPPAAGGRQSASAGGRPRWRGAPAPSSCGGARPTGRPAEGALVGKVSTPSRRTRRTGKQPPRRRRRTGRPASPRRPRRRTPSPGRPPPPRPSWERCCPLTRRRLQNHAVQRLLAGRTWSSGEFPAAASPPAGPPGR
mmetsp:Transcript_15102/g.40234  ORF Transcript_15102/g.40234 Transcript_15102/m.40234 type:complete len:206 (+) Transcript_15102:617-1234(+)